MYYDVIERNERMYKDKTENVEVYFICYKKEDMNLIETYYDEILDVHSWYINAYLAYKEWQNNFRRIKASKMARNLLTVAASRYLMYCIENDIYDAEFERKKIMHDLNKIDNKLQKIIALDKLFKDLD